MTPPFYVRWWLPLATFLATALAAGSAAFWGLKLMAAPVQGGGPSLVATAQAAVDPFVVGRALGGGQNPAVSLSVPAPDASASRFKLAGVVADKHARGYALIAVDGKPARPFQVGSPVSEALLLQSVSKTGAMLAASLDGPMAVQLDMPKIGTP